MLTFRNLASYIQDGRKIALQMPHFIFIQQISVLNILNMLYNLHFFSLQNAVQFVMLPCLVSVLLTFEIQSVLKFEKIIRRQKVKCDHNKGANIWGNVSELQYVPNKPCVIEQQKLFTLSFVKCIIMKHLINTSVMQTAILSCKGVCIGKKTSLQQSVFHCLCRHSSYTVT